MSIYDDYNDFHADIYGSEGDLESGFDDLFDDIDEESGLATAGFGTDEDCEQDTPLYDDYYGGE